ncbi:T9SS type A sorting domain-containing protein [Dyadobacter sandarakinus]|uniref:Secretion system C-terminal sorting domain-containing protein n=1 Tax=Dyadobacter sandarakinus TaxID=2747268 RepID=A0ABX7IFG3_9BACT|nr:T9SS type A sorting domain-containing protein [Dyadobacter sandarakinus]QRR03828.1 hypothetical protein HWI92_24410 [Dyadobacter sandarakinus]
MKTSIKTIAATFAFAALFTFNSFAGDKEAKKTASFETGIFVTRTGNIHVSIDKFQNTPATVIVTDKSGKAIYREMLGKKTDKYRRQLNVSSLPAGNYSIEISAGEDKITRDFELSERPTSREISIR